MDGRGTRKILAVNPNKRLILELQSQPQLWRDSNNTSFECKHNLYSSVMSKEGGGGKAGSISHRGGSQRSTSPHPLSPSNRVSKRINWYSRGVPSARPRFILQDEGSNPAKLIIISIVSAPVSFPVDRSGRRVPISHSSEKERGRDYPPDESRDENDARIAETRHARVLLVMRSHVFHYCHDKILANRYKIRNSS